MRVQQFEFAADLDAFNREVYVRSAEAPKWPPDENATYATGAFWVEQSVWAENGDHVVTRPSLVRTTVAGEPWTGQAPSIEVDSFGLFRIVQRPTPRTQTGTPTDNATGHTILRYSGTVCFGN